MNMRFLSTVVGMLLYAGGVQAQFTYTTNNDTITITGYTGSGGNVVIPSTINTYSVTAIGTNAFNGQTSLTGVTIPDSVTNIGAFAFADCRKLTSVTIPDSVLTLGSEAFIDCTSVTSASIGNDVSEIQELTFFFCTNLAYVTIGSNVTYIGALAFDGRGNEATLQGVYFRGNAPSFDSSAFYLQQAVVVFYLPETSGWGSTYDGYQTIPWDPEILTDDPSFNFGVGANGFEFTIKEYGFSSTLNYISVVEACTNLVDGTWIPLQTNVPNSSPYYPFNDPQWTNHPARFYRVDMP